VIADDAVARRAAVDPFRSFIVRAPAGSGKTTLLTQRFLALLAVADEPEQIVAVTFTRKAAAEMRARIIDALRRTEAAEPIEDETTARLARAAAGRDEARAWGLSDDPTRLRIETIDALAAGIAHALPLNSGLAAHMEVLTGAEAVFREAAGLVLRDLEGTAPWSEPLANVLRHLDNDVPLLLKHLSAILARRDQWLRLLGHPNLREAVEANIETAIGASLAELRARIPASVVADLVESARYAARKLANDGVAAAVCRLADLEALPGADARALPLWRGLADWLLRKDGRWRSRLTAREGFLPGKDAEGKARKALMEDVLDTLRAARDLDVHLDAVRRLPEPHLPDATWTVMEDLLQVLRGAVACLNVLFAERGQADFIQIGLAALRALGESEAPSDLALALDHRISHLLIDEFQDTSYTQYELMRRLTAGWQAGDGRTLFLVGDPLQSIYRFREADVYLFEQTFARGRLGDVALEPLTLQANFRSQPGIIDWLNDAFPRLAQPVALTGVREVAYTSVEARARLTRSHGVRFHLTPASDAGETAAIVALIQNRLAAEPTGSIAVLVRSRRHIEGLSRALREAGVACEAADLEPAASRPVIIDLVALACTLLHPADPIAWLSVLRAPWCGLTLADLSAFVEHAPAEMPLADLIQDPKARARVSSDGQRRLERVCRALQACSPEAALREQVEELWLRLQGPACVADEADFGHVMSFFALLDRLEPERRRLTAGRLKAEVERIDAGAPLESGGVLLTTIHKAKGLEFDTVIIAGADKGAARDAHTLLAWTELSAGGAPPALLFAPVPATGTPESAPENRLYAFIRSHEQLESELELRRLLYVALTRARQEVHVFGQVVLDDTGARPPLRGTLLAMLWPVAREACAAMQAAPAGPVVSSGLPRKLARFRLPAAEPAAPAPPAAPTGAAPAVLYEWAGLHAKLTGTVVHEWLQRIAGEGVEQWPVERIGAARAAIARRLRALGVSGATLVSDVERCLSALSEAVSDPRGRWILSARHTEPRAEFRLTGRLDGGFVNAVIDRTFVDEQGVRWIIDYKTSVHLGGALEEFLASEEERYRPQLMRYAELFRQLDPRPIRLGLYFPLLRQWREVER
jgi:ATP-dependent exoDNAse (exonuclease V) beta subunit